MRVRVKLIEVRHYHWTRSQAVTLCFEPRYDEGIPAGERIMDVTPNGRLEVACNNAQALASMALGDDFYLDFTPAVGPSPDA